MAFKGTTAIVTGGASGLGLGITEALVARGAGVAGGPAARITGQIIPVNGGRRT